MQFLCRQRRRRRWQRPKTILASKTEKEEEKEKKENDKSIAFCGAIGVCTDLARIRWAVAEVNDGSRMSFARSKGGQIERTKCKS